MEKFGAFLLTGGDGHMGHALIPILKKQFPGARIIVVDKQRKRYRFEDVSVEFVVGDVCNAELISHLLESRRISSVIHLAAETCVDASFGNSVKFTKSNLVGTHTLLESARVYGKLQSFLFISSDEVFGNTSLITDVFNLNLAPVNPYASSKASAELLCNAYFLSYKMPIMIARFGNVYGPGQDKTKMIPSFIMQALTQSPLTIHGNGSSLRSWLYLSDAMEAILLILLKGQSGVTYDIGSDVPLSVLTLAHCVLKSVGVPANSDTIHFVQDRNFFDSRKNLNLSLIRSLGWTADVSIERGLQLTIEQFKLNPEHTFL